MSTQFRTYTKADEAAVVKLLLPVVAKSYPGGAEWLELKLAEAARGKAIVRVASVGPRIVGVTIETPKGPSRRKLSTLYVRPEYRAEGVGSTLIQLAHEDWLKRELEQVHATADATIVPQLQPLLLRFGMTKTIIEPERYGPGRDEAIFVWKP